MPSFVAVHLRNDTSDVTDTTVMPTTTRTRVTTAAVAVVGAAGLALTTGPGGAGAAPSAEYPIATCFGLSPNVVDVPYMPRRVIVSDYAGTTYLAVDYTSYWIGVGYNSDARLDWHNLRTGKRGTLTSRSHVSPPYQGVHNFTIPTRTIGTGKVRVTLNTVNRNAVWSVPATTCGGTITVR